MEIGEHTGLDQTATSAEPAAVWDEIALFKVENFTGRSAAELAAEARDALPKTRNKSKGPPKDRGQQLELTDADDQFERLPNGRVKVGSAAVQFSLGAQHTPNEKVDMPKPLPVVNPITGLPNDSRTQSQRLVDEANRVSLAQARSGRILAAQTGNYPNPRRSLYGNR